MTTKVQRWGNSQGVRVSRELLEAAQIAVGEEVKITAIAGTIVIEKPRKFDLAEMVSRMPKDYTPEEFPATKPVGKEEW